MTSKLRELNEEYSDMTGFYSLGRSVEGREIWCFEISVNPGNQSHFRPNVKYIGNMHGDEVVGRELLMSFIDLLLVSEETEIVRLRQNLNIFIVPSMNPDGFSLGNRHNKNGYDLNRNFPDQFTGSTGPEQPEVAVLRNFIHSKQWTLSANFHGGDLVANYPYDGLASGRISSGDAHASPDDDVFQLLSKTYASKSRGMMNNRAFKNGITNGAHWYTLYGGMQDYNYWKVGAMEITLEVSMNKWPAASYLAGFWADNKDSMISYLQLAITNGVKGRITDSDTHLPLGGVAITVEGRENFIVTSRAENGAFWRLLAPGVFKLHFNHPLYHPIQRAITITAINKKEMVQMNEISQILLDIKMTKIGAPEAPESTSSPLPAFTSLNYLAFGLVGLLISFWVVYGFVLLITKTNLLNPNIPGDFRPDDAILPPELTQSSPESTGFETVRS